MPIKGEGRIQKLLPEIIEFRDNGLKNTDISKYLGVSVSAISRVYNQYLESVSRKKQRKNSKIRTKTIEEIEVSEQKEISEPKGKLVINDQLQPQVQLHDPDIQHVVETRTSTTISQNSIHKEKSEIKKYPVSVERYVDKKVAEEIKSSKQEVFVYNVFLKGSIVPKVCRSTLTLRKLFQSNPPFVVFEKVAINSSDISYVDLIDRIKE